MPNAVTVGRAVIAAVGVKHVRTRPNWAVAMIAAGACGDAVDGWLARKLDASTALGARLDPVSDRVVIASGFVVLWHVSRGSRPPVLILSLREMLLTVGAATAVAKRNTKTGVTATGKSATVLVLTGAMWASIAGTADWPRIERVAIGVMYAAVIPSYVSLGQYGSRIGRQKT